MKKTLLAVAVAAALPAAAFAQVTLYGVADVGIGKMSGDGADGADGVQMMANGNGSSRFGMKGAEDLGGGLTASFQIEGGWNPETGAGNAGLFDRAATVALSGGFGKLLMGRTLSPSFFGVAQWELTGTANYSVQYNTFGAAGGDTRNNSQFTYTTPSMGGFAATLGYMTEEDRGSSKIDANVVYGNGPINVGLSYNKWDGTDKAGWGLGGSYNFGVATVAASVVDQGDQWTASNPSSTTQPRDYNYKGYTLGVSVPLGGFNVVFDMARVTTSGYESTNYLLEGKYPLSKRTFVYGAYRHMDYDDLNVTQVGVRHNF